MSQGSEKYRIIQLIFIIAGSILLLKAASLQVFDPAYRQKAESTTLDKQTIYPSRGLFLDRDGRLLIVNGTSYELHLIHRQMDPEMDTTLFCQLLNLSKEEFEERANKNWRDPRFSRQLPFPFLRNITAVEFSRFQEQLYKFPGFYPKIRSIREYPHSSAAHVLGYISEIDPDQLKELESDYAPGDYIGANGLEKIYEPILRGRKGTKYILRDNLGREVSEYKGGSLDSSAVSGEDIQLGLDLELQSYAEALLAGKRGSIVAIEPQTGEILTMVSAPYYDPNMLSIHRNRSQAFQAINQDSLKPFFDRSIMAKYPPGSIIKPIMSLITMQEGTNWPKRRIHCKGYFESGNLIQGCHQHPTPYSNAIAIQHSCNNYYSTLYKELIEKYGFEKPHEGLNLLNDYLQAFGLGHRIGVDVPNENPGFIPDPEFYDRMYNNSWRATYIISNAIGQGEVQLTTLQMANLAAIIANRGYYFTPHLIKQFQGSENFIPSHFLEKRTVPIDSVYFNPVVDGMELAVRAGTAYSSYHPDLDICGKTGTSENPHGEDHSVFFAFAPKDNPKIAIAVFVENAGFGGELAAPMASLVIEKYLKGEIAEYRKALEKYILERILIPTSS